MLELCLDTDCVYMYLEMNADLGCGFRHVDTLFSQDLSPPRCINGTGRNVVIGVTPSPHPVMDYCSI